MKNIKEIIMKNIVEKINESSSNILSKDNLLGIMCAVKCLIDDNANFSLELKTKNIKPSLSEKDMFNAAQILIDQDIWEISKK